MIPNELTKCLAKLLMVLSKMNSLPDRASLLLRNIKFELIKKKKRD